MPDSPDTDATELASLLKDLPLRPAQRELLDAIVAIAGDINEHSAGGDLGAAFERAFSPEKVPLILSYAAASTHAEMISRSHVAGTARPAMISRATGPDDDDDDD